MCYLIELQGPEDVLDLANLWTDEIEEEHSGDELAAPSYAYEASGGPDVSGGLDIADQWSDSEDPGSEPAQSHGLDIADQWSDSGDPGSEAAQSHSDWSYGPQHFNFLRDDMFEYDELNDDI